MTLPAGAAPLEGMQLAQAPTDTSRPAPGPRPYWGPRAEAHGGKHGHHGWHRRAKAHRFSLSGLALRHQKDLALTPAQVTTLRRLGTDARRDGIKRQADRRLAELDLRTMMAPDAADPNKPRDLAKIETKVREIEKLRADDRVAQIQSLEQSRQTLTPEQRDKLRSLLSQRGKHHGKRGTAPAEGAQKPATTS
ncbi:MAG: Spy/CpxP family protein refolding chaperone [Candidatus Rokuibacteriota bacterium]